MSLSLRRALIGVGTLLAVCAVTATGATSPATAHAALAKGKIVVALTLGRTSATGAKPQKLAGTVSIYTLHDHEFVAGKHVRAGQTVAFLVRPGVYLVNAGLRLRSDPGLGGCRPYPVRVSPGGTSHVTVGSGCRDRQSVVVVRAAL